MVAHAVTQGDPVVGGHACHHRRVSEEQKQAENRARPTTEEFRGFVREDWAERRPQATEQAASAPYAAQRRDVVSAAFPKQRLIVPAGGLKVRSNDTDYVFRPHSAFAHLTGLGADREPDAVLVLEPTDDGTKRPSTPAARERDSDDFSPNARPGSSGGGAPSLSTSAERGRSARQIAS